MAWLHAKTVHWLLALEQAVQRQFPHGSRDYGLHLMSDNGCQPNVGGVHEDVRDDRDQAGAHEFQQPERER
ncbi:MAG: hypothetical protein NNA31_03120 [Nitrospira sp.]|nr:hypothetical protein [Nitrospira sp.]